MSGDPLLQVSPVGLQDWNTTGVEYNYILIFASFILFLFNYADSVLIFHWFGTLLNVIYFKGVI